MVESFIKKGSDFLHHEAHHHPKCNLGFICGVCAVDNKNESIVDAFCPAEPWDTSLNLLPSLNFMVSLSSGNQRLIYRVFI